MVHPRTQQGAWPTLDEVGPGGLRPLGPTTYAAPRSAFAIHSGSTIRGVGTAGSSPLAPTSLTLFHPELAAHPRRLGNPSHAGIT